MSELPNELRRLAPLDHSHVLGDVMREAADEIERLQAALAPFAATARGIPDNWPGECHLRIDGEPMQLGDFAGCREWLCYHGVHDVQDACLPTITQWREAKKREGSDASNNQWTSGS